MFYYVKGTLVLAAPNTAVVDVSGVAYKLTISESTSSLLKVVMIGVCPLLYLGIGIFVMVWRKKVQNEAV